MTGHKLNIGAARTYLPGFQNIDVDEKADISLDLSHEPLPFEDDSVDLIFSYYTLEHIADHMFALAEMYRVLRHDGTLLLGLPYVTSTEFHLVNPYHLHNYSEHSFDFFDVDGLRGSAGEEDTPIFKQLFCRYRYRRGWRRLPSPLRNWSRRHLYNIVNVFDVGLVVIKDRNAPVDTSPARGKQMLAEFDVCVANRTRYAEDKVKPPALNH